MKSVFFCLLIISICGGDGFRILGLFPHPGMSHFKVFHPIMKGLAEAGHFVTVVSYFPDKQPHKNYQDFKFEGQEVLTNAFSLEGFTRRTYFDNFKEFFELADWGYNTCSAALDSSAIDKVLDIHNKQPFDLIITEYFCTDCMLGIAYKMKVPFIGLSSCALMPWHYDRVALPDTPSYIPSEFGGLTEEMSFWERLENWVVVKAVKLMYRLVEIEDNKLLRAKFGDGIPDVAHLVKQTSLILVNQHHSLSGSRPLNPAVVEVGGVHIPEETPLPKDVQEILDTAKHGVIYISWGSVLRGDTLPDHKRIAIVNALKKFKQTVLWKWENETMTNQPDNVVFKKWLPQRDVLCHPNVKVFMAHGGLLGISEAVYCGVPIVVTPIYGDQFLNAAAVERRGMGYIMKYENITQENVYNAIRFALNPRTLENVKKVSESYKNRQETPLKTAIWWIEYIAETRGGPFLKSYASEMSWFVYHSIDVYLMILACVMLVTFIVKKICSACRRTFVKKTKLE